VRGCANSAMWKIATLRSSSGLPKAPSSVDLAAELLALKPAVIVAGSPPAALAVQKQTRVIPIVMNSTTDPVGLGLAGTMARPGGNVTV